MVGAGGSDGSGLGGTGAPPGLVLFAHAGDAVRGRGRNAFLAEALRARGFRTATADLLSGREAADPTLRHDVGLLRLRLETAIETASSPRRAPLGIAASAAAAAAALEVAAMRPGLLDALALRSPRLLAARASLPAVWSPTLLIFGACDRDGRAEAADAMRAFGGHVRLQTVTDADRSFEEAGALDAVVLLMADWFAAQFERAAEAARRRSRGLRSEARGARRGE